jgi:hypothetical protein
MWQLIIGKCVERNDELHPDLSGVKKEFFLIPQAKAMWQFIIGKCVETKDELTSDLSGG